jgi:hypothetical protein
MIAAGSLRHGAPSCQAISSPVTIAVATYPVVSKSGSSSDGSFGTDGYGDRRYSPERGVGGTVNALLELTNDGTGPRATRRHERVRLWKPSSAELASLAGEYRSDEVDVTYRLAIDKDRVELHTLWLT